MPRVGWLLSAGLLLVVWFLMMPKQEEVPQTVTSSIPTVSPVPPTPTVSLPPAAGKVVHIIQNGDTLSRIGRVYKVPPQLIAAANNIADEAQLYTGQVIVIPQITPTLPPPLDLNLLQATPVIPPPRYVNHVPVESFVIMPPNVRVNLHRIFKHGQTLQRNPRAFSKLGDSTIENPFFLARFDEEDYHLGEFVYLKPVIMYFEGSFGRQSQAVHRGLHTWSVLDPMWASGCESGEHMLACEFRQHNPSVLFIRMGSNDAGIPDSTEKHLREIVQYSIDNGVIPVLGTKADRVEGAANTNNDIIRKIAADLEVPLWDFDLIAQTLPDRGLGPDSVHMTTFYAHDWRQPEAFTTGHGVHNISALIVLDAVWRELSTW